MAPSKDPFDTASALARAGRFPEALAAADRAVAAAPRDARVLAFKGALQLQTGDKPGALATCEAAVALDPDAARAHGNLGDVLQALGRKDEALASYERAVALDPRYLAALVNRGNLLLDLKKPEAALASYQRALEIDPRLAQAHANSARVLIELDRPAEGLAAADRAIALQAGYARAWARRGDALLGLERFEEALESYRAAVARDDRAYGLAGAAQALKALGRYGDAIEALDESEARDPDAALAPYQRSMVRLIEGDFAGGWRDYEARWRHEGFYAHSNGFVSEHVRPRLALNPAAADFDGREVLVAAEQGIGDQLMHASMLPDVLARAGSVTWICDRRLHGLLGHSFPAVRFEDSRDAPAPDLDAYGLVVAAGSLGGAFRRAAGDFPGGPYVAPRPAVAQAWADRLGPRARALRIGLSWRGGTKRTDSTRRSMSLAELRPLADRLDAEFVSLQYGDASAEAARAPAELGAPLRLFPAAEIDDFEQLAGLIANLDLVVSVQTSLVHLCGALGAPCLAMVPTRPEWRYMARGEAMPWYRSVRIFRQGPGAHWGPVVQAVAAAAESR